MEFGEKLQELRKSRGLTQEELAGALYVSRTAVSKWESCRGYPSIESLKEISSYFSVSIDDLLSSEKLLSLAEKENKSNISRFCDLIIGIVDLFYMMLMVLPVFSKNIDGYVLSVNLISYTDGAVWKRAGYWLLFISLVLSGIVKIFLTKTNAEKINGVTTVISMGLSIFAVLFFALTREVYAVVATFLLLTTKGMILLKREKAVK